MSRWTSASVNLRPIKRFVANRVFSGLTTACRFAETPTNLSPSCANATTDGVVRAPTNVSARKLVRFSGRFTFRVLDYLRGRTFHNSYCRIGSSYKDRLWACNQKFSYRGKGQKHTQVNANDWSPNLLIGIIWVLSNERWTEGCAKKICWSCGGRCSSRELSRVNIWQCKQTIEGDWNLQLWIVLKITWLQLLQGREVSKRVDGGMKSVGRRWMMV